MSVIAESCRPGSKATLEIRESGISPMHIVVANDFAHVNGGMAQVAVRSAIGLAQRGYHVTFFAAVGPVDAAFDKAGVDVVFTDQYDIKTDPVRIRAASQGLWNFRAAARMKELLARLPADRTIVHIHGWTKSLSSSFIRAALDRGVRVVITLNDYFFACPNGGFFNFTRGQACHLQPLSLACLRENCDRDGYLEKIWRSARQAIQNHIGITQRSLLTFVTVSDFSETVLREYLPPGAPLFRITNPCDLPQSEPVPVARNVPFVFVGRLSAEKGLSLLAKAARELDAPVVFVGDGPCREEILNCNSKAVITGWQSREQISTLLRSARCSVLPSLWYEAQPLSINEAASIGVPAIVPDQCAAAEMVENGVTGLWFKTGNCSDLRQKMELMLDNERASKMGCAAYERYWKQPFTLERHVHELERCYASILASS